MDVKQYKYTFTVFTPTYNRAYIINRVFDSLMKQTFKDFEWLIVDDGSSDNTQEVIEEFKKTAWFPIRYIYKENGGKHTAYNRGIKEANGELFLVFDSDDSCIGNALERFYFHWNNIPSDKKDKFFAMGALCQDQNGKIIGDKFPEDVFDSDTIESTFKYNIQGEKWGFLTTDIAKQYPFKVFENERFVTESSVWFEISKKYKARYINEALRIYEINDDSLSFDAVKIRRTSPKGTTYSYLQQLTLNIPFVYKVKAMINCFRFSFYNKHCFFECIKKVNKFMLLPSLFLAFIMYLKDKK